MGPSKPGAARKMITAGGAPPLYQFLSYNLSIPSDSVDSNTSRMIATIDKTPQAQPSTFAAASKLSQALALHKTTRVVKPEYHPPWKLVRVISGHLGWVRSVAVEPGNQWFATGAGDRVIKIWDLASGELKLSLTGHISTVRGLAVSTRHPYLFSCGEDKVRQSIVSHECTSDVIEPVDGQVLGSRSQQSHPTLSWAPIRSLFSVTTSNTRCIGYCGPRRVCPGVGHADEGPDSCSFWPYGDRRRRKMSRIRPAGYNRKYGLHCAVSFSLYHQYISISDRQPTDYGILRRVKP